MSKFLHGLFQVLATIAQFANIYSNSVPPRFQPLVAAGVGLAQAGVALYNHKP